MNRTQLVAAYAERRGTDLKKARADVDAIFAIAYECITRGERLLVTGFGSWEAVEHAATTDRFNPGKTIPAHMAVKFHPSSNLKRAVRQLPVDAAGQEAA